MTPTQVAGPGRGRTTQNCSAHKTRTEVASQEGGGRDGELHTTALPTSFKLKSPVKEGGGGDIHTTALSTGHEHKSPVREGKRGDIEQPCLQDSNTSRQSGRGEGVTYNRPAYKTRTQVASQGGGKG